jgi:hexosaminidase
MPDLLAISPLLLPRPRSIESKSGRASNTLIAEIADAGASLRFPGAEAYALRADESGVTIAARTTAGIAHARRTLAQLRAQYGNALPRLAIEDAPAFPTRGVMLDISRDRVPTMAHLLGTADLLAALKLNHLQLYTEHTFAYRGHEEVWRDASPMTPAEVPELDAFCRARSMELAANQNCFGHLATWLRMPRYAHLAETHGDWVFENEHEQFRRSGPFSLCPIDPASIAFVDDLLGQLVPCFRSALVNIGCDETFDVGSGRSRDAVAARGRAAIYTDFVKSVASIVRRSGKRPMLWADIALSHPESLGDIPDDMIGLAWGYEPDANWRQWCELLRNAKRDVWVCPGTSSWRSITGRSAERRANLTQAARDGLSHGATGFLVTDWGDSGHHQQWPIALVALAEAADAAWTGGSPGYDPRAASLHAFGDRSLSIASWLDALGDVDEPIRRVAGVPTPDGSPTRLRNSSALFNDLHAPCSPRDPDSRLRNVLATPLDFWHATRGRIIDASRHTPLSAAPAVADELRHTLDEALFAADKAIARRAEDFSASTRRALADRASALLDEHRRLWLLNSRPGGLDSSSRHYQRIIDDLRGGSS